MMAEQIIADRGLCGKEPTKRACMLRHMGNRDHEDGEKVSGNQDILTYETDNKQAIPGNCVELLA
jgi:hypothetical protein